MFPAITLYSESMDSGQATYNYRYDANLAEEIELKWQARWEQAGTYHAPNPSGSLADSTPN